MVSTVFAILVAVAGCTSTPETTRPTPPVEEEYYGPNFASKKLTVVAIVEAVDLPTRRVTLRGPAGNAETIVVGQEVRNLPQVRVGDRVVVEYYQSLALALTPAGSGIRKRSDTAATLARARPGEKPAGMVVRTVEVNATVLALDRAAKSVTLRGLKRTVTLDVSEAVDLNQVNVGDEVQAVYDEALGISVRPAQ